MQPFYENIEHETLKNNAYRNVRYTDEHMQIVYMSLLPLEEIGSEIHPHTTQFFRVEKGDGLLVLHNNKKYVLKDGMGFSIPAGTRHNIINTSTTEKMKLYTIYAPPQHPAHTFQEIKLE